MVKIRNVKTLQQDIEYDPIIKDQMANLGCLLVCTFGNFLAPVLVATHRVNNLDLGDEEGIENEGYESDLKNLFAEYFVSVVQTQKELSPAMPFIRCDHHHTLVQGVK